jgi:hypothetical protein
MALSFTGRRFHDEQTGTVTFPAWSGSTRVPCRITAEALMFLFGAQRTDSGLLEAFDRNKTSIEVAAAWKFEAEKEPLSITLRSADFPEKKPVADALAPQMVKQSQPERPAPERPADSAETTARLDRFRRAYQGANAAHSAAEEYAAAAAAAGFVEKPKTPPKTKDKEGTAPENSDGA